MAASRDDSKSPSGQPEDGHISLPRAQPRIITEDIDSCDENEATPLMSSERSRIGTPSQASQGIPSRQLSSSSVEYSRSGSPTDASQVFPSRTDSKSSSSDPLKRGVFPLSGVIGDRTRRQSFLGAIQEAPRSTTEEQSGRDLQAVASLIKPGLDDVKTRVELLFHFARSQEQKSEMASMQMDKLAEQLNKMDDTLQALVRSNLPKDPDTSAVSSPSPNKGAPLDVAALLH